MAKRVSLLRLLLSKHPESDKESLYARILSGEVYVGGERVRDPRRMVSPGAEVAIRVREFVSRGGVKLDFALREWKVEARGKVFIDAGASTGGFTDCLLQHGAARVHTVDVGQNQLAYRLRADPRVIVHEGSNILSIERLDPPADAAVADLSFRSIIGVARHLLDLTRDGWLIALVKPQFELRGAAGARGKQDPSGAGRSGESFRGVIRDSETREAVVEHVAAALAERGLLVERRLASPITGRKGNLEYLFFIRPKG